MDSGKINGMVQLFVGICQTHRKYVFRRMVEMFKLWTKSDPLDIAMRWQCNLFEVSLQQLIRNYFRFMHSGYGKFKCFLVLYAFVICCTLHVKMLKLVAQWWWRCTATTALNTMKSHLRVVGSDIIIYFGFVLGICNEIAQISTFHCFSTPKGKWNDENKIAARSGNKKSAKQKMKWDNHINCIISFTILVLIEQYTAKLQFLRISAIVYICTVLLIY